MGLSCCDLLRKIDFPIINSQAQATYSRALLFFWLLYSLCISLISDGQDKEKRLKFAKALTYMTGEEKKKKA